MLNNKFFLLPIALLAVSSSALIVRLLPETNAITIAFWRMLLASIMVFVISYKTLLVFVPTKEMLFAGIFLGIHFALFFRGVQLTSIAEASLLGTTAPIFTGIYGFIFQKNPLIPKVVFGLFLAFVGAGALVSQSSFSETGTLGNILALLSSIAISYVLVAGKEIRKSFDVFEYTRWLFFFAAATLFVISLFTNVSVFTISTTEFPWFVFLALVPTVIGHNIFYYLLKALNTTTVAAVPLGEPVISSVGALVFFGEPITAAIVFGGGITLFGVFLVVRFGDE
ncbi:MAG: EamA family transporter [Candidatus Marinimicrobia bacterium]|jgi:drug/metabolite transporter (DMT)-like permease|nr:EamA family transporter [Candidatus Neomarinimicrobiota bacterium]MBT7172532.1 EamA family transporter [Candidatus Neomarinimicrobiota bacterium]